MKVLGLIAEYNPFHYGHKHHLKSSLKETNCNYSLALMSGSFVQRGMPSFIDKWTKAKMAVDNGVDLVIELPTLYSCQSAELFALGAIRILNSMKVIDYLSFGSEEGDLRLLKIISNILLEEPVGFKENLSRHLSLGYSFPVSRSLALVDYLDSNSSLDKNKIKDLLKKSNNILGIEYLKALSSTNSNIRPYTIKRVGADYKDKDTHSTYSSATAIRNVIINKNLESAQNLLPLETFNLLKKYIKRYNNFNSLNNYNHIIRYLILTRDLNYLQNLMDVEEGLENRIVKYNKDYNNIEDIISQISTKRYPLTRIQRILTHMLLNLDKDTISKSYNESPQYIRVLASNKKGFHILNKIKENSSVEIITKFSNYKRYNNHNINLFLDFEKKVTDSFFLGLDLDKPLTDMDFYTSPYIK